MGDSQRENARFPLKWGFCEEKTRDFRLNGGFAKTRDFRVKWGISEEKTRELWLKWGICEGKTRDFHLNGGFSKRKRRIIA